MGGLICESSSLSSPIAETCFNEHFPKGHGKDAANRSLREARLPIESQQFQTHTISHSQDGDLALNGCDC